MSVVDLGKNLLDASRNGDVEEVRILISNGAPFSTDWLGISPLHYAAMNGHLSTCEALIGAGINRDARTKVDRTPLHLAAQEGHADIVELLLKNGADLEATDTLKMTALHWAAKRGHYPVIQVLMGYGANLGVQNKFEMTPLDVAEYHGHVEAKDAMLTKHIDVNSVVGKMAAPNEDLADPHAFIITDEETMIPAAPPADEVVITSDKVDSINDQIKGDPFLTEECKDTFLDWTASGGCTFKTYAETGHSSCLSPADHYFGHSLKPEEAPFDSQLLDSFALPENSNSHHTSAVDNLLLVETPEGKLLYVRQEDCASGPKLVIFSEDGELVNDEALLSQVVNALANYPAQNPEDKRH